MTTPVLQAAPPANTAAQASVSLQRSVTTSRVPIGLQTKLTVNTPGDRYEQEADRVAEQVMRMPEPKVQRQCACGKSPAEGECSDCKKKKQESIGNLQRVASSPVGGIAAPQIVDRVLSSPGTPLPTATRTFMESRFGQDFSQVRVHTNQQAADSAASVQARAYTVGTNIVFGRGEGPTQDRRLLAHELTHTIQQTGDTRRGVSRTPSPSLQRSFDWCWSPAAWWSGECELAPLEATEDLIDSLGGAWKEYVDKTIDKILEIVRSYIPEGPARTAFDIVVGVRQGAVEFIEGIIGGVFALLKKSTWKGLAEFAGKIRNEGFDFLVKLIAQVIAQTINEYEKELVEARSTGKVAQVRAKWITRIIAEVVSLIIPGAVATKGAKAGSVAKVADGLSTAAKASEAIADAGKVAKASEVATASTKGVRAAESVAEASKFTTRIEDTAKIVSTTTKRAIRVAKNGLIWVCHSPCERLVELFERLKPHIPSEKAKEIERSLQRLENMSKAYAYGELPEEIAADIKKLTQEIEQFENRVTNTSGHVAEGGAGRSQPRNREKGMSPSEREAGIKTNSRRWFADNNAEKIGVRDEITGKDVWSNQASGKDIRYYTVDLAEGEIEIFGSDKMHRGAIKLETGVTKGPTPGRKLKF